MQTTKRSAWFTPLHNLRISLTCAIVVFNMAAIPFRWGFSIDTTPAWFFFDALLDLYLWFDIAMNFRQPFERDGFFVHAQKDTARNYLHSWFVFDIIASFPLDILQVVPSIGIQPILRLNRVVRILKVRYYAALYERFTQINTTLLSMTAFLVPVLFYMHCSTCCWFWIIQYEGATATTDWIGDSKFLSRPLHFQYICGLYWTLIIMTGYGGPSPRTDIECGFQLIVVLLGIGVVVAIIGVVGSLVSNFDSSAVAYRQKMDAINDYLDYRALPLDLQNRVRSFYTYMWKSRKGLDESKVLDELPEYLRLEMALFLNKAMLEKVPLFQGADMAFISTIVMRMHSRVFIPGTYIVKKGETGREMFFISRGEVQVVSEDGNVVFATLRDGSFFGEIALVTSGKRMASVRAASFCDCFVLEKEDFDEVLADFPEVARSVLAAAEARYNLVQKQQKQASSGDLNKGPSASTQGQSQSTFASRASSAASLKSLKSEPSTPSAGAKEGAEKSEDNTDADQKKDGSSS